MDIAPDDFEYIMGLPAHRRRSQFIADGVPRFLYKFRPLPRSPEESIDITGLQGLLERNEVFFSSPLSFNDLHEGLVGFSITPDSEKIAAAFEAMRTRREALEPGSTAGILARPPWPAGSLELKRGMQEIFRKGLARAGVFSTSASPRPPHMWAYYANDGFGACVVLSVQEDPNLMLAEQVKYSEAKPDLPLLEALIADELGDAILAHLTTKALSWKQEDEWRLIHRGAGEIVRLHPKAISGVVVGPRTAQFGMEVLWRSLDARRSNGLPKIPLFQALADADKFDLKIRRFPA